MAKHPNVTCKELGIFEVRGSLGWGRDPKCIQNCRMKKTWLGVSETVSFEIVGRMRDTF